MYMVKRVIVLVNSPLQTLCAIEAIKHFSISDYVFVFLFTSIEYEKNRGALLLCQEMKIPYKLIIYDSKLQCLKQSLYSSIRYDSAILGNFENILSLWYAIFSLRRRSKIIYVDDGTDTLSVIYKLRKQNNSRMLLLYGANFLKFLKRINNKTFYTYFSVKSSNWIILRNNFSYFKSLLSDAKRIGVYLIATNFSEVNEYLSVDYKELLRDTICSIQKIYPGEQIFYCPHRRDAFLPAISQLLQKYNIHIFQTRVSVEYDFLRNKIYPKAIFGFGSSALFSFNILYNDINIYNIPMPMIDNPRIVFYRKIDSILRDENVGVLDLNK